MTAIGSTLAEALSDRYVLEQEIGRGGMATVYLARDVKHDRTVALKVLHDDLAASLGPERFKREILIAARLQHPHVLSVFDSGETAGRLWFTMPFVNGESVRDRLRREGRLPVETALAIVREAAQALAYAHKQGVIHRDIKPENILLTEDGSTLVADFGIARAIGDRTFDAGLTQTGITIGTPAYMAPEQATGETVLDERVDQYALAAVLYEMLTGAPPFTGATAAALIAARFTTAVTPVRAQRTEVPSDVDAAVQRALALKAFDRFPTITEFARAVAPSVATPPQFSTLPSVRAQPAGQRRLWGVGAGVVALVAVVGAAFLRRTPGAAKPPESLRIVVLPFQNEGDSADAYFAQGMTDEVRGKLLKIPGVQVIARASSLPYANTTKSPGEIAKELGVRYLLSGTIRWERTADGKNVVHLRPELVEVNGTDAATTKWQQSFDQPLVDVVALQARIATQVAGQLQVALGARDVAQLAAAPTANAEAYDAYLRAIANMTANDPATVRERIRNLERAVELDPAFAMAWAQLATARGLLYTNSTPTPELERQAHEAEERAKRADPNGPAAHIAGYFVARNIEGDLDRAEAELLAHRALEPNNNAVTSRLGSLQCDRERFDGGLQLIESATRLDPLNAALWGSYARCLLIAHRYDEARMAATRMTVLGPTAQLPVLNLVQAYVAVGDRAGAQAAIDAGRGRMRAEALDVYLAIYYDFGWILDDAGQQRVLAAPVSAFDGDAATQASVQAQIYRARGDTARSRQAGERSMRGYDAQIGAAPTDAQLRYLTAFAAALAGRTADARQRLAEAQPVLDASRSLLQNRVYYQDLVARIHVLNGEYDAAFDAIERLLPGPGMLSRGALALDPIWAPLRGLPRYQRLMSAAGTK
jgi:serine/threonine-protein kinase